MFLRGVGNRKISCFLRPAEAGSDGVTRVHPSYDLHKCKGGTNRGNVNGTENGSEGREYDSPKGGGGRT